MDNDLSGLSEVLEANKIATPSTNLADDSISDSEEEEEISTAQAIIWEVQEARKLMKEKKIRKSHIEADLAAALAADKERVA